MTTKDIVMKRVRRIHFMRPFVSTAALAALLALVSLYAISREVWVAMVFANMPSLADLAAVLRFFAAAFLHTSFLVQAFSVLALVCLSRVAFEIAQTVSEGVQASTTQRA